MRTVKKLLALSAILFTSSAIYAGEPYVSPSFDQGWSFGIDGGATTPLKNHAFFGDMRGWVGAHLQKQISPAFGLGVESYWGVNTSSWSGRRHAPAFDNSYTGVYGAVDLPTLFGGMRCGGRLFGMELAAGAGFGHEYDNDGANNTGPKDRNYFATKAGLNFNFNVNNHITLSVRPAVIWNMTGTEGAPLDVEQTSAAYTARNATFNITAGVAYRFGRGIQCASNLASEEIDALNGKVNSMRAELASAIGLLKAEELRTDDLQSQLRNCRESLREVSADNMESILYVYYELAQSNIRESQQPIVEMIASYLKSNPEAKVIVKGYASKEGELEFNERLSADRAESVKSMLESKYGIASDRIKAEGCGILEQFKELSWNRVAICIITKE